MRSEAMLMVAGLLFAIALVAPSKRARADDTLLRLSRIARGDFRVPRSLAPAGIPYGSLIRATALRHGVSPALLAGLVRAESGFKRRAVSSAGAQGLGQLMPATARSMGVRDVFNPAQNLDGSARYLAKQYRHFGDVRRALAAYNAGPKRAARSAETWPAETRQYVARVMRFEREYRARNLP